MSYSADPASHGAKTTVAARGDVRQVPTAVVVARMRRWPIGPKVFRRVPPKVREEFRARRVEWPHGRAVFRRNHAPDAARCLHIP